MDPNSSDNRNNCTGNKAASQPLRVTTLTANVLVLWHRRGYLWGPAMCSARGRSWGAVLSHGSAHSGFTALGERSNSSPSVGGTELFGSPHPPAHTVPTGETLHKLGEIGGWKGLT
ncbi:hypothetical protein GDO86_008230 [Hymenochirus boettgeri]|uniref:Uncharacterized protein n=1 Tax=Hymenochirus boettgeri TaxID=247094 RepID=A0A8T2J200_9PIPI|nr:hypothetical protein GDO86_008230 [Hymenochirus boettgeri]